MRQIAPITFLRRMNRRYQDSARDHSGGQIHVVRYAIIQ